MNRRSFLAGLSAAALAQPKPADPWNFVVILADDLGARDLGCYGNTLHETPNLDRLAAEGMKFTQAYAACPVCSPTRASILTGKYPARTKVTTFIPGRPQWPTARLLDAPFALQLAREEQTIPELLAPKGYSSAIVGKWHLGGSGYGPEEQGFRYALMQQTSGRSKSLVPPATGKEMVDVPPRPVLTTRLGQEAELFIRSQNSPFFLYFAHHAPHIPVSATEDLVAKYKRKLAGTDRNPTYSAMIESMDATVGRVLQTLEERGIADRTVVMFLSDNGGLRYEAGAKEAMTNNAPFRAGKGHLFEGGIRIPWLVRWPGVTKAGSTSDVPVITTDILPTLAAATGVTTGNLDGMDLRAALRGQRMPQRDLYWHFPHYSNQGGQPGHAIRSGDWKLIQFFEDQRLELYNLRDDVGERRNLAKKEAARAKRMLARLEEISRDCRANLPAANPGYDPAKEDQGLTGWEKATPAA